MSFRMGTFCFLGSMFKLILLFPVFAFAAPLFEKGPEQFELKDNKGQTPHFRILSGSVTKEALAMAINSIVKFPNAKSETQPYVDLLLEKLTLTPEKSSPEKIGMVMRVSGRDFEIDTTLSKSALLKGQLIEVKPAPREEDLAMFSTTTNGKVSLKYDPAKDVLLIPEAKLDLKFKSPLSDEESEHIQFSGKGIHLKQKL